MNPEPPVAAPFADVIPSDLEADTRAVIATLMTGAPLDAETYQRIRQQADRVRDAVQKKHGLLDIGVPAIRELRDA